MQKIMNSRLEAGDPVSFLLGGRRVEGLIVEDRGPLAGGGKHLYRVLVSFPFEEPASFEMPEDEIVLNAAPRGLFSEMANRVVQKWWYMPVGALTDHLTGYQALARAVFEASREVVEAVRNETAKAAHNLGLDTVDTGLLNFGERDAISKAQEQAIRVSQYAREHGSDGLHEEIERVLMDAAAAARDRLLLVAREQGWHGLEQEIRGAARRETHFPFLAFLAE
jgi:hypothetical protein